MNIVDPILLTLLSLFALRGYFKGLFREVFSLGGLVVGFIAAVRYDEPMAGFAAEHWEASPFILRGVAFVVIFFVVYFFFSLVGWLLHHSEKFLFLQTLNRLGGVAVGLGKGTAVLALIVFFLISSSWVSPGTRQKLDGSYLVPPLSELAQGMIRIGKSRLFPEEKTQADGRRQGSGAA